MPCVEIHNRCDQCDRISIHYCASEDVAKHTVSKCMANRNYAMAAILYRRMSIQYMVDYCESLAVYHSCVENRPRKRIARNPTTEDSIRRRYGV